MIWRNETYRHNMFRCDNGCLTSHRDDRVKISRGQRVGKIAEIVGEKCTDQREVGAQGRLKSRLVRANPSKPVSLRCRACGTRLSHLPAPIYRHGKFSERSVAGRVRPWRASCRAMMPDLGSAWTLELVVKVADDPLQLVNRLGRMFG